MDVLVVGGGGREHAIVRKIKQSPKLGRLYCIPGNAGIAKDAVCPMPEVKATDIDSIVGFAADNRIDLVVVTPDDPLALGMVDALNDKGILAFGPDKAAAQIESSKVFSKSLMKKYGIPTASYAAFNDLQEALGYVEGLEQFPAVVKADGLALGKGVIIAQDKDATKQAVLSMMQDKVFGNSGSQIVIEEFLTGPEVTVLAFTDSDTIVPMASSMDHKRAFDGNLGANTGGMGTIAPNPHYGTETQKRCMDEIFIPTINAMKSEGRPFKGCLYFGLILTGQGPRVIEYNCRFGDPETQVVLELLDSDLLEIMVAVAKNELDKTAVAWKTDAAACVVAASGGYPEKYETGYEIEGLDENGRLPEVEIYHAGTKTKDGRLVTSGGRVLGVTATAKTLDEALSKAYTAIKSISFKGMRYRSDIGKY